MIILVTCVFFSCECNTMFSENDNRVFALLGQDVVSSEYIYHLIAGKQHAVHPSSALLMNVTARWR